MSARGMIGRSVGKDSMARPDDIGATEPPGLELFLLLFLGGFLGDADEEEDDVTPPKDPDLKARGSKSDDGLLGGVSDMLMF